MTSQTAVAEIEARHPEHIIFWEESDPTTGTWYSAYQRSNITYAQLTNTTPGLSVHIPAHEIDKTIAKLTKAGHKCAVCQPR